MIYTNDPIPGCVPELYRERQEEQDRQFDLAMRRRKIYRANQEKLDAAAGAGLPILGFGGYNACGGCPHADHDTQTDDEDDFCRVICHDPSCRCHRTRQNGEESW